MSRALIAVVAAMVIVAAAGYWWLNRPTEWYKPDNSGLYPISVNGKYGFMDRSGKTIITPQFDRAGTFSEGLASVRAGTKWGYINTKGAVVITPQFDDAMTFRYGRAAVKLCCGSFWSRNAGDRFGFIDKDGKFISTPDFTWVASGFSGDLAPAVTAGGVTAFVDHSGKILLPGKYERLGAYGFTAGLAPVATGGKWGYIDATGKWVINPQFEGAKNFAFGIAPVIVGGRTGYIDENGKFVVNPQYDSGDEFYDGYARFGSGGKFGFIDTKGKVVVAATFQSAGSFSEGLAAVKTEDGWGFIDRTGKLVITPQFDDPPLFQNGLARVTVGGKEAYVTQAGAFVLDPFPGRAGIPAHPVQELWTGTPPDGLVTYLQRFILIREGPQIRGYSYHYFDRTNHVIELKGQAAQDGSFNMTDQNGTVWKGKFVSSMLINGVQVNPPGASVKEFPVRLRLVRDATARESEPLPPTNSDWSAFLSNFKDAVERRSFAALSLMMARSFSIGDRNFLTPDEASPLVRWDQLGGALARGVETSSSTPWGSALRSILDERPGPNVRFQVRLAFSQDGNHQWRWTGIAHPGD